VLMLLAALTGVPGS
jgi:antitoxin FitA